MAGMLKLLPVILALALQQVAGPTPQQIREQLEQAIRQLEAVAAQLPKTEPITTAAQLQAALDNGGDVEVTGGSFTGTFTFRRTGTTLRAHLATFNGGAGPAFHILPDVDRIGLYDAILASSSTDAALQCGDNGSTQTRADQVPQGIVLHNIQVPSFRGKHALSIHCSGTLTASTVADAHTLDGADSQAVWVHNTCGPFSVIGGTFTAGSENILIGGDTLKVTDCPERVPADLTFDGVTLIKPEAWRTDGVRRAYKNLFEAKAGKRVRLLRSRLSGSWVGASGTGATQDGSAIVLTPKNSQYLHDVLIDGNTIDRASSGLQLLGFDYNTVTPQQLGAVVVRNNTFTLSRAQNGGRGILALSTGGMGDSLWEGNRATFDGPAILVCDTPAGKPQGPFVMRGTASTTGQYAVMANGVNYGGPTPPNYAGRECATTFEGNTFANAPSRFKTNYPTNTWVTLAELEQLLAAPR